jgi:hypothetical protein
VLSIGSQHINPSTKGPYVTKALLSVHVLVAMRVLSEGLVIARPGSTTGA